MNEERIPLRQRRDLSEIIQDALSLYGQNFGTFFLIATITVPIGMASAALQDGASGSTGDLFLYALFLLGAIANLVATGALIAALVHVDEGRQPSFSDAYEVAFNKIGSIIGAELRVLFHVLLLGITIIGIPWAIQRLIRWLFVAQAVVIDDRKANEALSQSAAKVEGMWWRTLGTWSVIIVLLVAVPNVMMTILYYEISPGIVMGTAVALVGAFLLPFAVTALTLLYLDLTVRKEAAETSPLAG